MGLKNLTKKWSLEGVPQRLESVRDKFAGTGRKKEGGDTPTRGPLFENSTTGEKK